MILFPDLDLQSAKQGKIPDDEIFVFNDGSESPIMNYNLYVGTEGMVAKKKNTKNIYRQILVNLVHKLMSVPEVLISMKVYWIL